MQVSIRRISKLIPICRTQVAANRSSRREQTYPRSPRVGRCAALCSVADRANKVSLGILRRIGKFCSVASPRTVSDMSNTPTPQQNHLLAALPAQVQNRLLPYLELVPLTFGTALYECGDTFYHVCFPTDSIVLLLYRMENGASGEISMVGNEGLVGIVLFLGEEGTPSRAVVQSAGTAYRLPAQRLKAEFH